MMKINYIKNKYLNNFINNFLIMSNLYVDYTNFNI